MKTITDTITDHTASAPLGIGAVTTVRSTAHTTVHIIAATGTVGDITIHGATTVTTAATILGTTADSTTHGTMIHGITEAIGEDTTEVTMPDITAGTTHGTTTTTDGITHTTVVRHTLLEVPTSSHAITAFALTLNEDISLPVILQGRQFAHRAAQSEAA